MAKAKQENMPAVAITDHGNMFGAFKFFSEATKAGIKPILGCEFYIVEDRFRQKFEKHDKDKRYHQLILAKNAQGYKNLSKLCSLGFIEGMYGKFPRIDRELLKQYKEGLIATSCCVAAEVPQTFLHKGEEEAEKVLLEYIDIFGEDYYIELQRHHLQGIDQEAINQFLIRMSKKHDVPLIATNDSHYVDQDEWSAHDILLCINTGELQRLPVGDADDPRLRVITKDGKILYDTIQNLRQQHSDDTHILKQLGALQDNRNRTRFGFENDQFYFKTETEMKELFKDVPQAIENTLAIAEKVQTPELKRDILMPNYRLPEGFDSMETYLQHLTYEGARKRYGEITEEIRERLDMELQVINTMGFAGYFLIVQDFIAAARKQKVSVGPGRGSAAGSAVAYCTGITNIDPIHYNLLFERFLNPERVSMPDIDIDFDDEGRQQVIDYVIDLYGKNQVAQIITYGTMAAKSAIRDVARVTEYPLPDTDALAKMIPDNPGMTLKKAFEENPDLKKVRENKTDQGGQVVRLAETLEGSIRQRGIHAAGVIIAPDDITNFIPVCTAKDADLLVTQFDGKVIEDAGMLKMDFLGLKTLTIAKDAVEMVEANHDKQVVLDDITLTDEKTFELYQKGETVGTFQFESEGMRTWLRKLKPTNIEDLIAMNALYRPGPMDFIPDFINRKHGKEEVAYPHPLLEDILKPTYGIMVYQEQIMQTAQIIGGFTLGKADILRRAMGKKKREAMQQMKGEFVEGAKAKEIDPKKAEEIFDIMAKFASYGFNRSHSAAYSVLAYQTAWLKAHYPAEYMASVLTHNMHEIKKVVFFIEECRKMGLKVLGPDVNESQYPFSVNKKGEIRFGLGAIKGVGEAAVNAIIEERAEGSTYEDVYDLAKRVNLRAVNKKSFESMAQAGAFDCFKGTHRAQYFEEDKNGMTALETAIKWGQEVGAQEQMASASLFGDDPGYKIPKPELPNAEEWPKLEQLRIEKELIGFYLSGHPLDTHRPWLKHFMDAELEQVGELATRRNSGKLFRVAGIVTAGMKRRSKRTGNEFMIATLEDYSGSYEFFLFSETMLKFQHLLQAGQLVLVCLRIKERPYTEGEYSVEVEDVMLLEDARQKMTEGVELQFSLSDIDAALVKKVKEVLTAHPGPVRMDVCVLHEPDKLTLEMKKSKFNVNPTNDFIKELEAMPEVNFRFK